MEFLVIKKIIPKKQNPKYWLKNNQKTLTLNIIYYELFILFKKSIDSLHHSIYDS